MEIDARTVLSFLAAAVAGFLVTMGANMFLEVSVWVIAGGIVSIAILLAAALIVVNREKGADTRKTASRGGGDERYPAQPVPSRQQLEQELDQIIALLNRYDQIPNQEDVLRQLDQAETALDKDNIVAADQAIAEIRRLLDV